MEWEWFETSKIKDEDKLTKEQIEYLKNSSITIFGPLNIIVRRHWDFLIASFLLSFISSYLEKTEFSIWDFVLLVVWIWYIYFIVVHGRRLAWNRNNWGNFENFKHSEDIWKPWGIIAAVIGGLIVLGQFIAGLNAV